MKTLILLLSVTLLAGCAMGMVRDAQRQAKEDYQVKQLGEVVCNQNLCQTTIFQGFPPKGSNKAFAGNIYELQVDCINQTYRTLSAAEVWGNEDRTQSKPLIYTEREQVIRPNTPAHDLFMANCRK